MKDVLSLATFAIGAQLRRDVCNDQLASITAVAAPLAGHCIIGVANKRSVCRDLYHQAAQARARHVCMARRDRK
jgi:hypothetical protein